MTSGDASELQGAHVIAHALVKEHCRKPEVVIR
jgi:hypothetical protein